MELLLKDGDYVADGQGDFQTVDGSDEVLQRALFQLTARRGSFPFLPELGSRLYTLTREKPSVWKSLAESYAVEALANESDLAVTGVEILSIDGDQITLKVNLEWNGESLEGEVSL